MENKRKRRRFFDTEDSDDAGKPKEANQSAASKAAALAASLVKGPTYEAATPSAGDGEGPGQRLITINDAHPGLRSKLTRSKGLMGDLQVKHGVTLTVKGKYIPQGEVEVDEKPLYLVISPGLHLHVDKRKSAVNDAYNEIEQLLKGGFPSRQYQPTAPPGDSVGTVEIGISSIDESFDFVSKLSGPDGSYLDHIEKKANAKVSICGKGSRNETGMKDVDEKPLHVRIQASTFKYMNDARRLAYNLVSTIKAEYFTMFPSAMPLPTPSYSAPHASYATHSYPPPPTRQQPYAMQPAYNQPEVYNYSGYGSQQGAANFAPGPNTRRTEDKSGHQTQREYGAVPPPPGL